MTTDAVPTRLVVSDWALDPHAVVAACARHVHLRQATFALLVPAWLHGLDWAGDPRATVPCAHEHLEELRGLCAVAGVEVLASAVGDPDPVTAIGDAVAAWTPADVLLCLRRRAPLVPRHPLDLAHRTERLSRLPVTEIAVPVRTGRRRARTRCQPIPVTGGTP